MFNKKMILNSIKISKHFKIFFLHELIVLNKVVDIIFSFDESIIKISKNFKTKKCSPYYNFLIKKSKNK
jgi:hypothetical protein